MKADTCSIINMILFTASLILNINCLVRLWFMSRDMKDHEEEQKRHESL